MWTFKHIGETMMDRLRLSLNRPAFDDSPKKPNLRIPEVEHNRLKKEKKEKITYKEYKAIREGHEEFKRFMDSAKKPEDPRKPLLKSLTVRFAIGDFVYVQDRGITGIVRAIMIEEQCSFRYLVRYQVKTGLIADTLFFDNELSDQSGMMRPSYGSPVY